MAEHPDSNFKSKSVSEPYVIGSMDIDVQEKTYLGFLKATKYLVVISVVSVLLVGYLTL